jgi:DNA-binding transcriptional LysR family regulator
MDIFTLKGLSFDRLRAFIAVFESESVTRAAGGDPTRQSQYSRQIRELEEALGVKLFDRRNRSEFICSAGNHFA